MSDLIDRQQAIDAINKLRESTYAVDYGIVDCDDAINAIATLPPTEPKRGKWICTGEPDESWGMMYECSICGNHDYGGNYCSYCGAKMEDENERSDRQTSIAEAN